MRIFKLIVSVSLLMTVAACAYYAPGYRPYYYGHPYYYR